MQEEHEISAAPFKTSTADKLRRVLQTMTNDDTSSDKTRERRRFIERSDLLLDCIDALEADRATSLPRDHLEDENRRLRQIISLCAKALPNGAYCSSKASLEFMNRLPGEIALALFGPAHSITFGNIPALIEQAETQHEESGSLLETAETEIQRLKAALSSQIRQGLETGDAKPDNASETAGGPAPETHCDIAGFKHLRATPAQQTHDPTHERQRFAAELMDGPEKCPICAEPFKPDDLCADDIELGTCHAACLEGAPVVNLDTGEALPDGKIDTYAYSEVMDPPALQMNGGPAYLDFITPDEIFDKGPAAVKEWQEAKRAEIRGPAPQTRERGTLVDNRESGD